MTPTQYRKRPVVIDAIEYTGTNFAQVEAFLGDSFAGWRGNLDHGVHLLIRTLENPENPFVAPPGWMVLRGVRGEHYACEPEIFAETYEPVEAAS